MPICHCLFRRLSLSLQQIVQGLLDPIPFGQPFQPLPGYSRVSTSKPKLDRGRPSSAPARKAAWRHKRIDEKVADLLANRYVFAQNK